MAIDLPCDWKSAFVMDPTKKQRCGYLTAFNGLDLNNEPVADKDEYKVRVFTPYNAPSKAYELVNIEDIDGAKALNCIGVIDSFSFGGGVGDPLCISAYVSTEFANQLKAKQKASLTTTVIKKLGWWVCNYDVEEKAWFEEAFPRGSTDKGGGFVAGQLNAKGGKDVALQIAEEGTKISSTLDIQVFHIYFEVVPGSDATYALNFAQAKTKPFVKGWGLQVGNIAKQKVAA
jgi:hypothetical protein